MGVLGKYGPAALKYYSAILESAYRGLNTADMWAAVRTTQAKYGLPKPGATAPDVSVIRGYANRVVNGARNLAAADPTDTITGDMMAVGAYTANDLATIATTPTYQVRYIAVAQQADGSVVGGWSTSVFTPADMPATVAGLTDAINTAASELLAQAAQQTGGKSGGTLLTTGNYEITVV